MSCVIQSKTSILKEWIVTGRRQFPDMGLLSDKDKELDNHKTTAMESSKASWN